MPLPVILQRTLAASSTTALVNASGTIAAGATFTLVATTLDVQRRLLFTPAGNESANVFTITGTNDAGNRVVENLAGANATTFQSNLDFKTVSSIRARNATAGTMSVGTNGVGSSLWQVLNWNPTPLNVGFQVELRTGAATFTVEETFDDPNNLLAGLEFALPFNSSVAAATSTVQGSITTPVTALRLTTTAGTGTLWFRMLQAGLTTP